MKKNGIILLLLSVLVSNIQAQAVWQWSQEVSQVTSSETNEHPKAFLWIPENCEKIKGVVFAQHNMVEEGILEHAYFRKKMAELGFAEVWVTPPISINFDFHHVAPEIFNTMMKELAEVSGYEELATAPVIPIGHSALASFPWNFASWNPERTLALVSVKGDAPLTTLTGSGMPNPNWGNRNIDGVPALFIMGEYEWMERRIAPAYDFISKNPQSVITLFADAGHGHFDYSDMLVEYIADYIEKAAGYRLLESTSELKSKMKKINPEEGWLMSPWRKGSSVIPQAAAFDEFMGDKTMSSWVFDEEMVQNTEAYYAEARGKRQQYIGFSGNDEILEPKDTHANFHLKFRPLENGTSFNINAFFADSTHTVPVKDYASTPLFIDKITGPVKKVNDSTFRIRFDKLGFNNPKRSNDIWLIAYNKGDREYKSVVQQINMQFPLKLETGSPQEIFFPSINNQPEGQKRLKLVAKSSVYVKVQYYVQEGPAYVEGDDQLIFTEIPPKAKYPVKVTVVAWQYGIIGKLQSAEPVSRSFYINELKH